MKFKLFSNCIPIKGTRRSIIYDLQREKYEFIPNDLWQILIKFDSRTVEDIKVHYGHRQDRVLREYFDFLIQHEFIFFTENPNMFPKIDLTYDSPSLITNAIIEVNDNSKHDFQSIFDQLDDLNCQAVEIRAFFKPSLGEINTILQHTQFGKLRSIELLLPYTENISHKNLKVLFRSNPRIARICIFSAPDYSVSFMDDNEKIPILYSPKTFKKGTQTTSVNPKYFVCNLEYFIEAINYSTYFNKKVIICSDGSIKNCSSLEHSFGNVKTHALRDVVEKEDFQRLWKIKKDEIKVCKDCEFRYMCTDQRVPELSANGEYVHKTDCNYNPYTMTWKD